MDWLMDRESTNSPSKSPMRDNGSMVREMDREQSLGPILKRPISSTILEETFKAIQCMDLESSSTVTLESLFSFNSKMVEQFKKFKLIIN